MDGEVGVLLHQRLEVASADGKAFQFFACFVEKGKSPFVESFKPANGREHAKATPVEMHVVDLVSDLVLAAFNEEKLEAFVHLGSDDDITLVHADLQLVHELNHEISVHFIRVSEVRINYLLSVLIVKFI